MKFEGYVQEASRFINEVARELGIENNDEQAVRTTTAVLHTVREILSPEESLHLIAQLPMIIKALYVNGWHINRRNTIRTMDQFIEHLMQQNTRTAGHDFGNAEAAKEKVKTVLKVLKQHVSVGELTDIINQFPKDLTELWLAEEQPV